VKSIVGNRDRCFVGSLNLDPRALEINTENGLFIDSEGLCGELADELHAMMRPENAWRVSMNKRDQVHWKSNSETLSIQPARNSWQRIADFFFRLLPIEDQI
jgi:putative cardiolipin synthase